MLYYLKKNGISWSGQLSLIHYERSTKSTRDTQDPRKKARRKQKIRAKQFEKFLNRYPEKNLVKILNDILSPTFLYVFIVCCDTFFSSFLCFIKSVINCLLVLYIFFK